MVRPGDQQDTPHGGYSGDRTDCSVVVPDSEACVEQDSIGSQLSVAGG